MIMINVYWYYDCKYVIIYLIWNVLNKYLFEEAASTFLCKKYSWLWFEGTLLLQKDKDKFMSYGKVYVTLWYWFVTKLSMVQ